MNMHFPLAAAAALLLAGAAQAAGNVSLSPALTLAAPGQAFSLAVNGSGFADPLMGGGLSFAWDPALMSLAGVSVDGVAWEFASFGGTLDATAGTLEGLFFASFDGHAGSFGIATLDFVAGLPGTGAVTMALDPFQPFINVAGAPVEVSLGSARVTVSAVPEPAAWALMAGGVAVLLGRRLSARR